MGEKNSVFVENRPSGNRCGPTYRTYGRTRRVVSGQTVIWMGLEQPPLWRHGRLTNRKRTDETSGVMPVRHGSFLNEIRRVGLLVTRYFYGNRKLRKPTAERAHQVPKARRVKPGGEHCSRPWSGQQKAKPMMFTQEGAGRKSKSVHRPKPTAVKKIKPAQRKYRNTRKVTIACCFSRSGPRARAQEQTAAVVCT